MTHPTLVRLAVHHPCSHITVGHEQADVLFITTLVAEIRRAETFFIEQCNSLLLKFDQIKAQAATLVLFCMLVQELISEWATGCQ